MRLRTLFALSSILLILPACDGPTAGELSIDLVTPSNSDGAILFKLRTPAPRELGDAIAACADCQAFTYRVTESEVYCAVTGPLKAGPLVRLTVSDLGIRSAYQVTILEVAGADRRTRSNVGYELRLSH